MDTRGCFEFIFTVLLFPFYLLPFVWALLGFYFGMNEPNEEVIVEYFGKPAKIIKKAGLYIKSPLFSSVKKVS